MAVRRNSTSGSLGFCWLGLKKATPKPKELSHSVSFPLSFDSKNMKARSTLGRLQDEIAPSHRTSPGDAGSMQQSACHTPAPQDSYKEDKGKEKRSILSAHGKWGRTISPTDASALQNNLPYFGLPVMTVLLCNFLSKNHFVSAINCTLKIATAEAAGPELLHLPPGSLHT